MKEITVSKATVQDGTVVITEVRTIQPQRCPHFIMVMEHYRDDGSCMCDDAEHRAMMIAEWGYTDDDFDGVPLRTNGEQ